MQEHFNFTDEQFKNLLSEGVTIENLYSFAKDFDFGGQQLSPDRMTLLHYIDDKGDFNKKPHFAHRKICRAILEKLNLEDKMFILEYISWHDEDKEN